MRTFKCLFTIVFVVFVSLLLFQSSTVFWAKADPSERLVPTDVIWQNFTQMPTVLDVAATGSQLWGATNEGVIVWNRPDKSYTILTTADGLVSNNVLTVAIDSQGRKWFGTYDGVSVYNGSNWTTYTTAHGLPSNFVTDIIFDAAGLAVVGTLDGVARFNGNTWINIPGDPSSNVTAVALDQQQNLWVGTYDSGTYRYNGSNWYLYGDPDTGPGGRVRGIALSPNGDIWFAFDGGGAGKFSGPNWTRYTTAQGLRNNSVQTVAIESDGDVWIGYFDSSYSWAGASRFNGSTWTHFNRGNVLSGCCVYGIAIDASGHKWLATNRGVNHFDDVTWDVYASGLVDTPVWAALVDHQGNAWLAQGRTGVIKYDGNVWTLYQPSDGLLDRNVKAMVEDHTGNIWFAIWSEVGDEGMGISRFDGSSWTNYDTSDGLSSNRVEDITVDTSGNVWFGTHFGATKFDGVNWTIYRTTNSDLPHNYIQTIEAVANDIWFGYAWNDTGVTRLANNVWTTFTMADGLPSDNVNAVDSDSSGNVWIGTGEGISRYNGSSWTNYTMGYPENQAWTVTIDNGDSVWVGSQWHGIARFDGTNWSYFNMDGGILSNEIISAAADASGRILWFGVDDGAIRFTITDGYNDVYLPVVLK